MNLNIFLIFSFILFSKSLKILIYGKFWDHLLLKNFNISNCENTENVTISRDLYSQDFDIIIIHFVEHDEYLESYKTYNNTQKKIMILVVFVSF